MAGIPGLEGAKVRGRSNGLLFAHRARLRPPALPLFWNPPTNPTRVKRTIVPASRRRHFLCRRRPSLFPVQRSDTDIPRQSVLITCTIY